jgi:hypothetical protein
MRNDEAGPSNEPKRAKVWIVASNILEWTFVSVFVFLWVELQLLNISNGSKITDICYICNDCSSTSFVIFCWW